MSKQSPSRTQRSQGFKVKHFLQICLLLALSIWLLNQLKHSYGKKDAYHEVTGKISEIVQSKYKNVKLGRKDLNSRLDAITSDNESQDDKAGSEGEIEDVKPEDVEDDGRGGRDDEIDGQDQERTDDDESEEVEDLIDVDDRDRYVGSEEQENEGTSHLIENASINQSRNRGERIARVAREETYKGDDASSSGKHITRNLRSELNIGGLRKIKVTFELNDHEDEQGQEKAAESGLADSYISSRSSSPSETIANMKSEVRLASRLMLVGNAGYHDGKKTFQERIQDSDRVTVTKHKFLQADSGVKDRRSILGSLY